MKPFGTLVLFVCVCFVKETLKKLEKSLEEATGKEEFEDIETIFKLVWNFTFLFCYLFRCSTFEQQIDFFFLMRHKESFGVVSQAEPLE